MTVTTVMISTPPCPCYTCFRSRGHRYPHPAGPLTREQADRRDSVIRWNGYRV